MSLQYIKKELSYEVDVLHADEHESLFQGDSIFFMCVAKHTQSTFLFMFWTQSHAWKLFEMQVVFKGQHLWKNLITVIWS